MKIVFMGTPDFAQKSLMAIYEAGFEIVAVVTNPDKPQGRGMKIHASPVKLYAQEKGIDVMQPDKIKGNNNFIQKIKDLNPDVLCVVAYGKILPKELLEIPKLGAINVHGSLLPKYRGAAPIQWAVLNGDKITGITTMYMDEGMDTGDMILKQEVKIDEDETTGELWERMSEIGGKLLVETLKQVKAGKAPRVKQGEDFTVAPMLNKDDAKIDWETQSAKQIHDLIRGLNPIMGAYAMLDGKKYKFWKAKSVSINEFEDNFKTRITGTEKAGQILVSDAKCGLYIKANDGILQVIEIQGENAKKMNICDFLRGNKLEIGRIFE